MPNGEAARQFINKWTNGGNEKQDCHPYWLRLLQNVLGVENAIDYIQFEKPVKLPEAEIFLRKVISVFAAWRTGSSMKRPQGRCPSHMRTVA